MDVGELVGRGRTSNVFRYGKDSVVKVANDAVADEWPEFESRLTHAVGEMGVMAPKVRDLVVIDGRPSVVFEYIEGPSMWQQMLAEPAQGPKLAKDLALIQKSVQAVGIPAGVPELVDRLARKIADAEQLTDSEQSEAQELVRSLPTGAALLHGDLHPGNILMGASGPVVIDWFDATIGHPVADVLRSSILMQPSPVASPWHLPEATRDLLANVHGAYLAEHREQLDWARDDLACWQAVVAAGRLAEGAEIDERGLLAHWNARADSHAAQTLLLR